MAVTLTIPDDALAELRPLFAAVEGGCEVWTDEEVATRLLLRGVLAYGQTAGRSFQDMTALVAALREQLGAARDLA